MADVHEIRIRSYLLWEAEGRPQGRDMEFWLRAEAELQREARSAASPWGASERFVVPRVPISSPPRRMISMRIPMRMSPPSAVPAAAIAARR